MRTELLAGTDLRLPRLTLGGNVFGWTCTEQESFAVLDAYVAAGGTHIDTADSYSVWAPGNAGGESESIIGRWLASRGCRDEIVLATKVSRHPDAPGLSARSVERGLEASLRRLRTDRVDLYYAHYDDPTTPLVESVEALSRQVAAGKARYLALSNFSPARMAEMAQTAIAYAGTPFVAVQAHYNLVHRRELESDLAPVAASAGMSVLPYYALASGYLTGKYHGPVQPETPRGADALGYDGPRARLVLEALSGIAAERGVAMAAVALAWLAERPLVASCVASARSPAQLEQLLACDALELSENERDRLDDLSAGLGEDVG